MCSSSHNQGLEKGERGILSINLSNIWGEIQRGNKKDQEMSSLCLLYLEQTPFAWRREENGFKHSQEHSGYSFRECLFRKTNPDKIFVPRQTQSKHPSWKEEPFPAAVSFLWGSFHPQALFLLSSRGIILKKKAGILNNKKKFLVSHQRSQRLENTGKH